jgi:hypothetical protein
MGREYRFNVKPGGIWSNHCVLKCLNLWKHYTHTHTHTHTHTSSNILCKPKPGVQKSQLPGRRRNYIFSRMRLIFVDPQKKTCLMSPFCHPEFGMAPKFLKICAPWLKHLYNLAYKSDWSLRTCTSVMRCRLLRELQEVWIWNQLQLMGQFHASKIGMGCRTYQIPEGVVRVLYCFDRVGSLNTSGVCYILT